MLLVLVSGLVVLVIGLGAAVLDRGGGESVRPEPMEKGWELLRASRGIAVGDELLLLAFFGAPTFAVLKPFPAGEDLTHFQGVHTVETRGDAENRLGMLICALLFGSFSSLWVAVPPDDQWLPHVSVLALFMAWMTAFAALQLVMPRMSSRDAMRWTDSHIALLRARLEVLKVRASQRQGHDLTPMSWRSWWRLGLLPGAAAVLGGLVVSAATADQAGVMWSLGLGATLMVCAPAMTYVAGQVGSSGWAARSLTCLSATTAALMLAWWIVSAWLLWDGRLLPLALTLGGLGGVWVAVREHRGQHMRVEAALIRAELKQLSRLRARHVQGRMVI
ncbi:hypothetical protein NMQ01_06200 [Janibacter sp. CX7]|uniref:hypothetical protein n=1 Tax=Janibacter sp. CX7 TaxID=2963431 RepID=UPI0020CE146E|nr:hypothetical protein [Janibacter sp. CX7]UTT67301.1 hypothetical protein NMQ01_06200 [Janibacter sp. CX7]